jgi:hypothetical protein
MILKLASVVVFGALGLTGCGVGGGGGGQPPVDSSTSSDSGTGTDSGSTGASITCTAQVALTGTFTAPAALDPTGGCQPDGMWMMTATVTDAGTCANVPLKASYVYTVTGVGRNTKVAYANQTGEFQGVVEASGDGVCVGSFEHILSDAANFDQLTLHPSVPKPTAAGVTTLAIGGTGEFNLWNGHP